MKRTDTRRRNEEYDVAVVGGGMAGLCAALSAARYGAKTVLIHDRPMPGGNASGEIRIHISGADQSLRQPDYAEGGLIYDLMLENKSRNENFSYPVWDTVLFEAAKKEPNLTLCLNTVMYDCDVENDRITGLSCVQSTTELLLHVSARIFVDATGNGTLGYLSGAEYRIGSESRAETGEVDAPDQPNNERMGNTVLIKAVDLGHPVPFTAPSFAKPLTEHQLRYRVHSATQKVDASMAPDPQEWLRLSAFSCKGVDYGYWWLELMGDGDDIISEYESIRDDLLAYAYGLWDHIKNGGDHGAENYALEWIGVLPGMRESRRLVGDYLLSETDILSHRIFSDAVCYGGWCVDLHAPHGLLDFDRLPSDCHHFEGVYTIPYRSYYSKNIANLMMAGRDISTTKLGLASTRILGCCGSGGQAVGTAAGLCIRYGVDPRDLAPHVPELQQILLKDDLFLPGYRNEDPADHARVASFSASSFRPGAEPEKVVNGISRRLGDEENGWVSDGFASGGEELTMTFPEAVSLHQLRLTFDSNFRYPIRITMSANRQGQQRPGVPAELVKDFDAVLYRGDTPVRTVSVRNNHHRLSVTDFPLTECDRVVFRFTALNGGDRVTVFEVRAY